MKARMKIGDNHYLVHTKYSLKEVVDNEHVKVFNKKTQKEEVIKIAELKQA